MKSPELSDAEIKELVEAIALANAAGEETCDLAHLRLERCLKIGEQLVSIKARIGHGKWESFCAGIVTRLKNTKVTKRTFQNWMRLYRNKEEGRIDLSTSNGIRQAYLLAGIVPESDDTKSGKASEQDAPLLVHILRLNACIAKLDISSLSPAESKLLRERLEPIHELYLALE